MLSEDLDTDFTFRPCSGSSNLKRSKSLGSALTKPEGKLSYLKRRGSFKGESKVPKPTIKSSIPGIKYCADSRSSAQYLKYNDNIENASRNVYNQGGVSKIVSRNRLPLRNLNERLVSDHLPSSMKHISHREKNQIQKPVGQNVSDFGVQLKKVTKQHGELMLKHATLRMQLIESISFDRVSRLGTEQQCRLNPGLELFSIPENSHNADIDFSHHRTQGQAQKLVQDMENENFCLQIENEKLMKLKKYWEKVQGSKLFGNELGYQASQKEVCLLEKLDHKENDLANVTEKVEELEKELARVNLELKDNQDNLLNKEKMLNDLNCEKDDLSKNLLECRSALHSAQENIDFLRNERSTVAETLQETEQSLSATKAEIMKEKDKYNQLNQCYRKLCEKIKQKNLSVQLLQAELDRAETSQRDILLNHSSECSKILTDVSHMSKQVQSILAATAQFSLNELDIRKDLFENVISNLDNQVNSASEFNQTASFDSNSVQDAKESFKNVNVESTSKQECSPITNSAFKPTGMANPFRPVKQQNIGNDNTLGEFVYTEDLKKASLGSELSKLSQLICKTGKAAEFIQNTYVSNFKSLNEEKDRCAEELRLLKYKHYELKSDFSIRKHIIEKGNSKITELSEEIGKLRKNHEEEKEKLFQNIANLNEEIHSLEALNAEQSRQISNEVKQMITVVIQSNSEIAFANALSEKLVYKQEIAKLKAILTEKDQILQQLAQKFKKSTAVLEENWRNSEKEVGILDEVIQEVYIILQRNPALVEDHDCLKELLSLVSGKCSLSDIDSFMNLIE